LLDVGAVAARSGPPVGVEDECAALLPAIAGLAATVPVSADTFQVETAGGCGYVLMHIEGPPRVDRPWREYDDVVDHLVAWFEGRVERMRELGVADEQIAIDPGLDFDLSPEQDLEIMRRLGELRALGLPLYVSLSRKDF